MGIFIIKVIKRIKSAFKVLFWRILYLGNIHIGKGTVFYPNTHLTIDCGKVSIGKHCFFNHFCSINCMSNISIGDNCIFGESVKLYDHNHAFSNKDNLIKKQGYTKGSIKIGNNCWIGSDVIILPNVVIGDNVVIAAGTIVTKNIEDNTIVKNKLNIDKKVR